MNVNDISASFGQIVQATNRRVADMEQFVELVRAAREEHTAVPSHDGSSPVPFGQRGLLVDVRT